MKMNCLPVFRLVAVILLINTVKLEKLIIIIRKALLGRISQRLGNSPCQERVGSLKALVFSQFWRCFRVNHY